MKKDPVEIKEVSNFIDKLKEERRSINEKLRFVHEHKFTKEADYLRDRVNTLNTILFELESVLDGHTKGIEVKFIWQ